MNEFVGREKELDLLDDLWEKPLATLLILYGRRRIGKTRLLTHWIRDRHHAGFYWVAEPSSHLDQLRSFSQALYNFQSPDEPAPIDFSYATWEQAFTQLSLLAKERKIVVFIDELGYLIDVNPNFAGTFQKAWDRSLSTSQIVLALSGSQMSVIQGLLDYDAPLYGRPTAQMKLPPLSFADTKDYFPSYSAEQRIITYGVWGGVPAYWERLNQSVSPLENVRQQLLPSNALMHEEPRILLQDFLTDMHNYVGIMRSIAGESVTSNRISTRTGLSKGHISKYINVLRGTGFVERATPITEDPAKSRRGHYFITDPYLRFYYRFIARFQAQLAMGEQEDVLNQIKTDLSDYLDNSVWREICEEWLMRASLHGRTATSYENVGGVWGGKSKVPVAGINRDEKQIALGITTWEDDPSSLIEIDRLLSLTDDLMKYIPESARWHVHYFGFSKNGWSDEAHAKAEQLVQQKSTLKWTSARLSLITLDQIDQDLLSWRN